MAKLKATEMLAMVADEAIQIHGGMGLMDELPLERIWRDARIERIWDGTSEIQRHIISPVAAAPLGPERERDARRCCRPAARTASSRSPSTGRRPTPSTWRPAAAMGEVFAGFRDDPELRVAIVRTAGDKFFCAGWDLKAAAGGDAVDGDYGVGGFGGLQELPDLNKPVIAAVHGMAVGGGFELALSCDLIYASEATQFGLPEINAGTLADAATVKLPKRIPYHVAMELLLTGRWMARPRRTAGAWSTRCCRRRGRPGPRLGDRPAARLRAAAGLRRDQGGRPGGRVAALPGGDGPGHDAARSRRSTRLYASEDGLEGFKAFAEKRAAGLEGPLTDADHSRARIRAVTDHDRHRTRLPLDVDTDRPADPSGRRRCQGRPNVVDRAHRRHGFRRVDGVRRAVRDADGRAAGRRGAALQPVPRHAAVLADPAGADDRPQPPLASAWASTSEMSTPEPGYHGYRPASAATIAQILSGNGYCTARGRQVAPDPAGGGEPARARSRGGRWARASTSSTASWARR